MQLEQTKCDNSTLKWSAFKCKSGKTYFSAKKEDEDDDGNLNTTDLLSLSKYFDWRPRNDPLQDSAKPVELKSRMR